MQSELIRIYMNKPFVNVDFNLACHVNCDNIHAALNEIYSYDWTYEANELKESIKVTLYVPGRILTGVANLTKRSTIAESTACALAIAFTNGCYTSKGKNNIEPTKPIVETIKVSDLENYNAEISLENDNTKSSFKNPYGIREDQIAFINDFKAKHDINSDEKFDYYIKTWSDNTGNEILTKNQLVRVGEKAVDLFIEWISTMELIDNNIKIISPL